MESLKNNNEIDMFYMCVIPGFNIASYESQSNFVLPNIKFLFQNLQTHPFFLFLIHPFSGSNLFTEKCPSDPTLF